MKYTFRASKPDHMTSNVLVLDSSWNAMAHGDAREGKWRGNWRMEWVAYTLHTISERGVSSTTAADAHTSAASSRLNWRPRRFKWTSPFRRKTKSGFCACDITFQLTSTSRVQKYACGTQLINFIWIDVASTGRIIDWLEKIYKEKFLNSSRYHREVCLEKAE